MSQKYNKIQGNKADQHHRNNKKVRSRAFSKKSEDDIPRINMKAIPIHHLFQQNTKKQQKQTQKQINIQFWGCITKQSLIRTPKLNNNQNEAKRSSYSSSKQLLQKYLQRRSSLSSSKHTFNYSNYKTCETPSPLKKSCPQAQLKQKLYNLPTKTKIMSTKNTNVTIGQEQYSDLFMKFHEMQNHSYNILQNQRIQRLACIADKRKRL